jgi:membrane protease YdiL (CAAX protease family)
MSLAWVLLFVLVGAIGQRLGWSIDPSIVILISTTLLLIPVWYFSVRKYQISWADLGIRSFQPTIVGLGCGLMVLSLLFNLVYAAILGLFGLQIQPDIGVMFNNTNFPIILLIGGAVIAPFVEEIFFRGFVFPGLRKRWDWRIAAVISAGLFALAHVIPTSFVPIFILGLIFAFLYQISGSIWPSVLMHVLTNSVALAAAYAVSQGWVPAP